MRRPRLHGFVGVLLVAVTSLGCTKKPAHIAELTKTEGPIERQPGSGEWGGASVGTKFYLGDAARTADGPADLRLAGSAMIRMDKYTELRFGGKDGTAKISVELGQIELRGAGNFGLDVGDVKLQDNGAVRITAGEGGKSSIQLLVGAAQIESLSGSLIELEIGKELDLGGLDIGPITVANVVDAGVEAAPLDAGAAQVVEDGTIEITGKKAEIQIEGGGWEPLPAGMGKLQKGATIRLGAGTTAKMIANGVSLSLAGGSRLKVGDELLLGLELGVGTASVAQAAEGKVGVPGGSVDLKGSANSGARARLDVNARGEAKVSVLEGGAKLVGTAPGAELDMRTGEVASLVKAGMIQLKARIPDYYDMKLAVGSDPAITIHDPRGSTAVQFSYPGKCPGTGTVEVDTDSRFRTARITGGKDQANILVEVGTHFYRLSCGGGPVAQGRMTVRRDAGTLPLPKDPAINVIDADGRTYRISYQSLIPTVKIKVPGGGSTFKLHLATGGQDEVFESDKPAFVIDSKKLKEATYTYWVVRDGVKQEKVSTLTIDFDQTAPQVYISDPPNGKAFAADVKVAGAVLPGWTAKVDGVEIPVDKNTRRFSATVGAPAGPNALSIRLSHPQRGVHYYLRRSGK
jgi:hypothetical protein